MLETVREYGLEQLAASGEEIQVRQQHADYYDAVIEAATPIARWPVTMERVRLIDAERDNLRATMAWLLRVGDTERHLRMATQLFPLWTPLGTLGEGRRVLEQGLAHGKPIPADLRALALSLVGTLAGLQGDGERALELLEEAQSVARLVTNPTLENQMDAAMLEMQIGYVLLHLGRYNEAESFFEQSLAGPETRRRGKRRVCVRCARRGGVRQGRSDAGKESLRGGNRSDAGDRGDTPPSRRP